MDEIDKGFDGQAVESKQATQGAFGDFQMVRQGVGSDVTGIASDDVPLISLSSVNSDPLFLAQVGLRRVPKRVWMVPQTNPKR